MGVSLSLFLFSMWSFCLSDGYLTGLKIHSNTCPFVKQNKKPNPLNPPYQNTGKLLVLD